MKEYVFEVTVTAHAEVIVEAESYEEALELMQDVDTGIGVGNGTNDGILFIEQYGDCSFQDASITNFECFNTED